MTFYRNDEFKKYQDNVTPKLRQDLADELGINVSKLDVLEFGWDPGQGDLEDGWGPAIVLKPEVSDVIGFSLIRWYNEPNDKTWRQADYYEGTPTRITTDNLLKYIDAVNSGGILKSLHLSDIADQFLKDCWTNESGEFTLRHYNESFWEYEKGYYHKLRKEALHDKLWNLFQNRYYLRRKEIKFGTTIVCQQFTAYKIKQIQWHLRCITRVCNDLQAAQPFTINDGEEQVPGDRFVFDSTKHILFKNGVLNVDTTKLEPLSPKLFTTSLPAHDYNPDAKYPLWEATVSNWLGGDKDSILLLQQWFGLNLLSDNALGSTMILYGRANQDKKMMTDILQEMLGDSCVPIGHGKFNLSCALHRLVNKNAVILSEDKTLKRRTIDDAICRLKHISEFYGHYSFWDAKGEHRLNPFVHVTYNCNNAPRFVEWFIRIYNRQRHTLCFNRLSDDTSNASLKKQLIQELPGIIVWAIKGLRSVHENAKGYKYLVYPEISKAIEERHWPDPSPPASMTAMGKQCFCFSDSEAQTTTEQLFRLHQAFFKRYKYTPYDRMQFGKQFVKTFPKLKPIRLTIKSKRATGYRGISILPEAIARYL